MQITPNILAFRTSSYARSIYMLGTQRFTARDGFTGIPTEYVVPVKQYAAGNYTLTDIDGALVQTWINQQEYDDTIALIVT